LALNEVLRLRARKEFVNAETHISDVYERVVGEVNITTLNSRQYAVIDPVDRNTGKPNMGAKELRKGEVSFFLLLGERFESGIQYVYVMDSEETLLLRAKKQFKKRKETKVPRDRWMIYGPCDFVPPVTVEILERRRAISLNENESIYVIDIKTGFVKAITGCDVYMLKSYEELWKKKYPKYFFGNEILNCVLNSLNNFFEEKKFTQYDIDTIQENINLQYNGIKSMVNGNVYSGYNYQISDRLLRNLGYQSIKFKGNLEEKKYI